MTEPRPLYHRLAWAYDLLLDEPIDARAAGIISQLENRCVIPSMPVLDAGCGTGRYASALASHGFNVLGVDRSPELVNVAQARAATVAGKIKFILGDLTTVSLPEKFSAILCRGVLNDFLTDNEREKVARRFADLTEAGGVLLLDVRDWRSTNDRYRTRSKTSRKIDLNDGGWLSFEAQTTLEHSSMQMVISESFSHHQTTSATLERFTNEFRMRCWSASELRELFGVWFEDLEIFPDYVTPPVWADRLVLVGKRKAVR
jgi:SAM-dependent methyltransferase